MGEYSFVPSLLEQNVYLLYSKCTAQKSKNKFMWHQEQFYYTAHTYKAHIILWLQLTVIFIID